MLANTPRMVNFFCLLTKVRVHSKVFLLWEADSCGFMLHSVHVVFPIAGTIAVYSCERDGFALLRNIQARYVGWAVLETALRQVAYHYIVKCLSEQGQGHSPPLLPPSLPPPSPLFSLLLPLSPLPFCLQSRWLQPCLLHMVPSV